MRLSGCESMIELEVNKVAEHRPLPCATRKGLDSDDDRLVLLVSAMPISRPVRNESFTKLALALSRSN